MVDHIETRTDGGDADLIENTCVEHASMANGTHLKIYTIILYNIHRYVFYAIFVGDFVAYLCVKSETVG